MLLETALFPETGILGPGRQALQNWECQAMRALIGAGARPWGTSLIRSSELPCGAHVPTSRGRTPRPRDGWCEFPSIAQLRGVQSELVACFQSPCPDPLDSSAIRVQGIVL